jgi:hypothetical protein
MKSAILPWRKILNNRWLNSLTVHKRSRRCERERLFQFAVIYPAQLTIHYSPLTQKSFTEPRTTHRPNLAPYRLLHSRRQYLIDEP